MAHEFGTGFDPDRMDGFDEPAPGRAHFEVVKVQESAMSKGGKPQMVVDLEVLAHTVPNQEAKTHREYFPWTAEAEQKALQFAVAVGLTSVDELKAKKNAGQAPVIDFNLAEGRQFLGELKEEEYEGRKSVKLGFRMYPLDSPKHRDYPRNQGKINQLGDAQADPFVSGGSTSMGPVAGSPPFDPQAQGDLFG